MTTEHTIREGLIDLCRHDQERLVKMALAKLHVNKFHRHYDDFYQEGCIAYARAYVDFKGMVDVERDRFYAFAYKMIYWRILDLLKKSWHQEDGRQISADSSPALAYHLAAIIDPQANANLTAIEERQLWASLMRALSSRQQDYLKLFCQQFTNAEIADRLHISRAAVYELRRRVFEVARELLTNDP